MVWVILPVKGLDKSKQRLAEVLSVHQRQCLAKAMLKDVLQTVSKAKGVEQILVVTADPDIARLAYEYDAQVLMEPPHCHGLNQAVDLGVKHAGFHGAERALVLHGDIPMVTASDITFLVDNHYEGGATLVPDKCEGGTNGLLIDVPTTIQFQYGEDSFHKHLESCREQGLVCNIAEIENLTLDIDSPEDLLELSRRLIDKPDSATSECMRSAELQQAIMDIRRAS